jgi:serine/threonine-protein kinase
MMDDRRVQQLLDEILDSDRTLEEVCADCPELLAEVRKRWQQMRMVEAELDALFPTPAPDSPADVPTLWHPVPDLPQIPGYEVEAILGRGGMGVVYKARHLRLNRPVALKMLLAGAYAGPTERERFLREAEAVAGLRHANIVQVFDVGDHDGRPYFTMEYIEGGSLAQKLLGTPQPAQQAAALLATLAEAVHVAHLGGIIHRDLKPANILLTTDGTPKIADFGLARHFDGQQGLTLSGARLGTPSYMAPEQAMGKAHTIGPATDIYALGALLYELLTGRPPFRGETAAETELQVIYQDPVAPSRLNPRVPRDLETICLKCLHKFPDRRYATAAALAEDLRRFQRREPIEARPAGLLERTGKWVRRHPTPSAILAASLLIAILLVGASLWFVVQQAHQRNGVEADLAELKGLQASARWAEARAVLERAEARLDWRGSDDLRSQLARARHEFDLVLELERIRLSRVTSGNLALYKTKADQVYSKAFGESGLAKVLEPVDPVAARVQGSAIRVALMAALDDWAICAADKDRRDWLLAVASKADPDLQGWRDRIRNPPSWEDRVALEELARTVPVSEQPVSLLLALGERLGSAGGDAPAFLKRVQSEHPADFWANLILGDALVKTVPVEAAGYYRAALASRPGAAVGYTALGDALYAQQLRDEATAYYRRALQIDPKYARGHTNLGNILKDAGNVGEAIACYRRALEVDPDYAWAHFDLANALRESGRREEALDHFRRFHALDPTNSHVANILRADLVSRGRGEQVRLEWKKELEADPPGHDAWFGYAELCLFLGDETEYRRARQDLLRRFEASSDPGVAERTARAILLLPATEDELQAAAALAERAVAAKARTEQWIYPYFLFAKGLAEYRQGRFDSAIAIMRGEAVNVMGPAPRLVIAMAEYGSGQKQEARETLAAAIGSFDWSAAQVGSRDHWIWHVLRREAESMILPDIAAFLVGKHQPQDNAERLALLGVCRFRNLNLASARLYADAFAADPKLADDPHVSHRYHAACAAALVGSGCGQDGGELSEAERAHWRKQSRNWLRAELAACAKKLDSNSSADRILVRNTLTHWQADPDLAGLREASVLDTLSSGERKECLAVWQEVTSLLRRVQKNK